MACRSGTCSSILMDHADLGQIRASFANAAWTLPVRAMLALAEYREVEGDYDKEEKVTTH